MRPLRERPSNPVARCCGKFLRAQIAQGVPSADTTVVTNSGLPGGNRNNNGTYNNIGNNGNWWSSTQNSTTNAWNRNLNYNNGNVNRNNNTKRNGFSVRCVRDLTRRPVISRPLYVCNYLYFISRLTIA